MTSLLFVLSVFAATGVYLALADSPPYDPDRALCYDVNDTCAELDGLCCEGIYGGCCVNGACLYNTTICKVRGEPCGRTRCRPSENCIRAEPCVCCPNCYVPILPTCRKKCGKRACLRNEECVKKKRRFTCEKRPDLFPLIEPILEIQ